MIKVRVSTNVSYKKSFTTSTGRLFQTGSVYGDPVCNKFTPTGGRTTAAVQLVAGGNVLRALPGMVPGHWHCSGCPRRQRGFNGSLQSLSASRLLHQLMTHTSAAAAATAAASLSSG